MRLTLVAAAVLGFSGVAGAQTGFWPVGVAPGKSFSFVFGLSQDGSVAVGSSGGSGPFNAPGFSWTAAGGRYDFGFEPGMPNWTTAHAVSSTGAVIAGTMSPDGKANRAYRWTGSGPLEDLGTLHNWPRSHAESVSGNGEIIVGTSVYTDLQFAFGEAFRWTPQGGMQGLGYLTPDGSYSHARAISRGGTTIVGFSQADGLGGPQQAFTWTEDSGMQPLPGLPGAPYALADARAVSADGSVAAGMALTPGERLRAVRWTDRGIEDLGTVAGFMDSIAYAISDAGDVVGGRVSGGVTPGEAAVWTPDTGLVLLSDYLLAHGVDLPSGLRLEEVEAISGDGLTFAGQFQDLTTGIREGFVATIPCPASVLVLLTPCLLARRRHG